MALIQRWGSIFMPLLQARYPFSLSLKCVVGHVCSGVTANGYTIDFATILYDMFDQVHNYTKLLMDMAICVV
jgi:hypothetical protein